MIAHLDLDAFFAAVEQLDRPELRGKPIVVGGDPRSRGVVSTASYEARAVRHPLGDERGRGATGAARARSSCTPDMARYRERSRTVWAVVASLVERFEQVGIDEGYLDLDRARARALGCPRAARRAAGRGARRDRALLLARLRHGQDRRQDRERPPQARRRLRGRAGPRGGVPGAAAAAHAAGHRAARRAAAAGGGPRHDRRPRPPGRRRRSRRSAWARSGAICASAPAASIRAPSSSRPPIPSRSARRRRSTTTCSTRSRWPPSSRRSPRTCSGTSSGAASRPAP